MTTSELEKILKQIKKMKIRPLNRLKKESEWYYDQGAADMKESLLSLFSKVDNNNNSNES